MSSPLDIVDRLKLLARGDHLDLADIVCADAIEEIVRLSAERQALRKVLSEIAAYCEAEPQTSAQAVMAKLAREALPLSSQTRGTEA